MNKYPKAPFLLVLLLVPTLLVGMGSLSIGNFLNSQGDTHTSTKVGLVDSVIVILISPIFVWMWGIFGLAFSIIISKFAGSLLGLYILNEKYNMLPDLRHVIKTLLCSVISTIISLIVVRFLSVNFSFLNLLLISCIFFLAFLFLAPIMRVVDDSDIQNLDSMLSGIIIVYPLTRILLEFESRIIKLTHHK